VELRQAQLLEHIVDIGGDWRCGSSGLRYSSSADWQRRRGEEMKGRRHRI
jgi:hypothetical protein